MKKKRVAILGSTGSIGTQALDVIAAHRDRFEVVGLAAGRNVALLREQRKRFDPEVATSADDGPAGLLRVAIETRPDVVLAATDGAVAFDAVLAAIERGTDVAVANKELIVAAGEVMLAAAARSGSALLPVDSEHSALFQCLVGEDPAAVAAIVLTASGGPFRTATAAEMAEATLERALAHPTWRMGTKNTIDSATMMNKGFEIIEACRLFDLPPAQVRVTVHPQSTVHSLVEFIDGSILAQISVTDMRLPILYALAYPERLDATPAPGLAFDLSTLSQLDFAPPDLARFPCLRLAYEAAEAGPAAAIVLNAADEIAVAAFLEGRIPFLGIPRTIEEVLGETSAYAPASIKDVLAADQAARELARKVIATVAPQYAV